MQELKEQVISHQERAMHLKKMSMAYLNGLYGVRKNIELGVALCREAVSLDDIDAIQNLAYYYQYGLYVQEDVTKAIELYDRASKRGHKNAFHYHMLISIGTTTWNEHSHYAWNFGCGKQKMKERIETVLLISKHRRECIQDRVIQQVMIKGIGMTIIKFLCHSEQKKREK